MPGKRRASAEPAGAGAPLPASGAAAAGGREAGAPCSLALTPCPPVRCAARLPQHARADGRCARRAGTASASVSSTASARRRPAARTRARRAAASAAPMARRARRARIGRRRPSGPCSRTRAWALTTPRWSPRPQRRRRRRPPPTRYGLFGAGQAGGMLATGLYWERAAASRVLTRAKAAPATRPGGARDSATRGLPGPWPACTGPRGRREPAQQQR